MNWLRLRRLHGCPPLRLSKSLAEEAQKYAEKMAREEFFEHSECSDYGENLITRKGPKGEAWRIRCAKAVIIFESLGRQAALAWYSEISFYNFKKENQTNCGHFCQVVWKDTRKAGFGVARSKDGRSIYVVGRYKKPGNYLDYYRDNVPLPLNGKVYVPTDEELNLITHPPLSQDRPKEERNAIESWKHIENNILIVSFASLYYVWRSQAIQE
ncbi:hypothetical protein ACTXT7_000891 [Hymenolepis weldensis]